MVPDIVKISATPHSLTLSITASDASGDAGVVNLATLKGHCVAGPLKRLLEAKSPAGVDLYTDITCELLGLGGTVNSLRLYPIVGGIAAGDAQYLSTCPIKATWVNGTGLRIRMNETATASAGQEAYIELRYLHSAQR